MKTNKMEGKLIKTSKDSYHNGHYFLNDDNGFAIGSSDKDWCKRAVKKRPLYVLSLTNCQAIERGYDLDELAREMTDKEHSLTTQYSKGYEKGIVVGFQKALEILGDKKFSEQDMYKMFIYGRSIDTAKKHIKKLEDKPMDEFFNDFIQSLQQTEWDVEIEMICPHPEDTYVCGIQYGCDEDGCNHPNKIPKLDADGYLILKQKL